MGVLQIVAGVLNFLLLIYVFVLLGRLVLEWIPVFNREWRPRGFSLVVAELVYTITDPPIRLFRRFIPPLRVGTVAIDWEARTVKFSPSAIPHLPHAFRISRISHMPSASPASPWSPELPPS